MGIKMSFEEEAVEINDLTNGLLLSNTFIPEEVVVNILVFVNWKDLLSCRLVCHSWKRLIDSSVCCDKLKTFCNSTFNLSFTSPIAKLKSESVPFYLYFAISQNVFGSNLLKNAFGSGGDPHVCQRQQGYNSRWGGLSTMCSSADCPKFKHWRITESGGDGWSVEAEPVGSQPLPESLSGRSCFITSYRRCHKEQCITLVECGLNSKIMDEIRPYIEVSEWCARRFDCGAVYKLRVSLLDSKKQLISEFTEVADQMSDDNWHQVSHTFKDYSPGVRHVLFEHEGTDTQFWAGHYGSKMAGGSVVARIPAFLFERPSSSS